MNPLIKLVVATRNLHKVQEILSILSPSCQMSSLRDFDGAPELLEDADTFAGNAIQKAVTLANWLETKTPLLSKKRDESRWFVLADDSGLEVDALDGAPGVHSARFAVLGEASCGQALGNASDAANNEKLLRLLAHVPAARRTARFQCVLALVALGEGHAAGNPRLFQGSCEGRIEFEPAGGGGFGYDPLFYPKGYDQSFAQLGPEMKNTLSHRAQALAALRVWLEG